MGFEYEYPRKYARDRLKGAEDGGPASADQKRAALEQCDGARIHNAGKADGQEPSRQGLREGKLLCKKADEKQKDGRNG